MGASKKKSNEKPKLRSDSMRRWHRLSKGQYRCALGKRKGPWGRRAVPGQAVRKRELEEGANGR